MGIFFVKITASRRGVFLLKAAIILLLILGGTAVGTVAKAESGNDTLRIIYSGGLSGNIEPCG